VREPNRSESLAKEVRATRLRRAGLVFVIVAAVVFSAVWNPPTGKVHSFTKASDYDPVRESGCTNSGKGCHGDETSYRDFNAYHKDAKCVPCHDYQGVGCIPCHYLKEDECPACHDGSEKVPVDRVRISDPFPRGHYREATHTAMGTDMTQPVHAVKGGSAKASCDECHSRDLRTSHSGVPTVAGSVYGRDLGCGECHNDTRSFGLTQVLSDWKKRRCEDCHREGASSPMHSASVAGTVVASGELGCGRTGSGCHVANDVHALHPAKPAKCSGSAKKGEPGCHVLKVQAMEPTVTACGGTVGAPCHRSYLNTSYTHKKDRSLHAPKSRRAASYTFRGISCGSCHLMSPNGTSLTDEHALRTSRRSKVPGDNCRNCHNNPASAAAIANDWSARDTRDACEACHGRKGLSAAHAAMGSHASRSTGCASTGAGCHPTGDLSRVGAGSYLHRDCMRCHDRHRAGDNRAYDPSDKTCGSGRACHSRGRQYDPRTSVHDGRFGRFDGRDDSHIAGDAQRDAVYVDPATTLGMTCGSCHSMVLGLEHARANSRIARGSGTLCVRCHSHSSTTASRVRSGWTARDSRSACAACHGSTGYHRGRDAAHVGVERAPSGVAQPGYCGDGRTCHTTTDLSRVHVETGCMTAGCHARTGNIFGRWLTSCGGTSAQRGCHAGYSDTAHDDPNALAATAAH